MYGWDILCGIPKVPVEIPHKISDPCIELLRALIFKSSYAFWTINCSGFSLCSAITIQGLIPRVFAVLEWIRKGRLSNVLVFVQASFVNWTLCRYQYVPGFKWLHQPSKFWCLLNAEPKIFIAVSNGFSPLVVNALHTNIFGRNIYLQSISFLYTYMTNVVEILPHVRQGPAYFRYSIWWLLVTWRRNEPGQQQPWYSPS